MKRLLIALLFCASPVFADGPLDSQLDVYLIEQTFSDDGEVIKETRTPAAEAAPGSVLEYVLTYSNESDANLTGFVIKNAVPANTSYVGESDTSDINASFVVSIDHGTTWESEPVTRIVKDAEGNEKEVTIPPNQYTNISWRVTDTLKPDSTMKMTYRAEID